MTTRRRAALLISVATVTAIACLGYLAIDSQAGISFKYVAQSLQCPQLERAQHIPSQEEEEFVKRTTDVLVLSMKELARAYRHARSSKTLKSIEKTHSILYGYLQAVFYNKTADMKLQGNQLLTPENVTSKDVCSEVWPGMLHGYPYYHFGHDLDNCSYAPAMSSILTVVLHFTNPSPDPVRKIISQIRDVYDNLSVIVLSPISLKIQENNTLTIVGNASPSVFTNAAIEQVHTKYTLLASDLYYFDNDTRIERLIRMIDVAKADIAAGSHRNSSGFWRRGCYQTKLEYYKYKVVEGYDLSYNSCIYCDYVSRPFLAKTDFLRQQPFEKSKLIGYLDLLNYFEDLKKTGAVIANCPDALFHTDARSVPQEWIRAILSRFAKHKTLVQIIFPEAPLLDGSQTIVRHDFSCGDIGHTCSNNAGKGVANLQCCSRILAETMKYLFTQAENASVDFEQDAGNLVGAVKFASVLPWELDADFNYRSLVDNNRKLASLIPQFKKDGYNLEQDTDCTEDQRKNFTCNYFALRKHPYRLECWGMGDNLAQDHVKARGLNVTKVYIDGRWYVGYYNPVKFARNRYGDDIFQHVEHWSNLGLGTSWKTFETGKWLPCAKPGFHACLDVFLPVGDLQFWEPSI